MGTYLYKKVKNESPPFSHKIRSPHSSTYLSHPVKRCPYNKLPQYRKHLFWHPSYKYLLFLKEQKLLLWKVCEPISQIIINLTRLLSNIQIVVVQNYVIMHYHFVARPPNSLLNNTHSLNVFHLYIRLSQKFSHISPTEPQTTDNTFNYALKLNSTKMESAFQFIFLIIWNIICKGILYLFRWPSFSKFNH